MNIAKRKLKDGTTIYYFRYVNEEGRKVTLDVDEYGGSYLTDYNVAVELRPSLEKKFEGFKKETRVDFFDKKINQNQWL